MSSKRALISTIPPIRGGVPAMLRTALRLFAEREVEVEVAWYEPYGMTPGLSVPCYRLGTRRVRAEPRAVRDAAAGHAVGAWFPELEFTHYMPTRHWRGRIAAADFHLVVSGTCLAGLAFERTGTPFLAWVASDWHGDRKDRVRRFAPSRRIMDRVVIAPVCRRLERRILRAGRILALSEATRRALDRVAGAQVVAAVLPQPIDTETFGPDPASVVPGRVGFVGRFDDPRKNVGLFLRSLAHARSNGATLTGVLIGAAGTPALAREISRLGLGGAVELVGELDASAYAESLRTLDLVAITSHQEGLHVAALEAMASGCPVVSTRCGGPEEYVVDGETGFLTEFDEGEIATRLWTVVRDRPLRDRLASTGREAIVRLYGWPDVRRRLAGELAEFLSMRNSSSGGFET